MAVWWTRVFWYFLHACISLCHSVCGDDFRGKSSLAWASWAGFHEQMHISCMLMWYLWNFGGIRLIITGICHENGFDSSWCPPLGSTCCHTGWGVPILYLVYEIRSWKDASLQYFHLEEPDFANSFMFSHARDFATFEVQQMRKISSKSFKVSHSFRGKIFS